MASRSVLRSLFFIAFLLVSVFQIVPSIQRLVHRDDDRKTHVPVHKIGKALPVHKIAKALWDSDNKIMSMLVQKELQEVVDGCYIDQHKLFKYWEEVEPRNINFTIFAAQDKSTTSAKHVDLNRHVFLLKLDKAEFDAAEHLANDIEPGRLITQSCSLFRVGLVLIPIDPDQKRPMDVVKITLFEIYKDDHVTVHGVDKSFTDPFHSMYVRGRDIFLMKFYRDGA